MSTLLRHVVVLGSTGSIGVNTLDVIARHPAQFKVFALTASTNVEVMLAQCMRYRPQFAVMVSGPHAMELEARLRTSNVQTQVLSGALALETMAAHPDADTVMANSWNNFSAIFSLPIVGDSVRIFVTSAMTDVSVSGERT